MSNDESRTAILVWDGTEYELKYTFNVVRRLRNEGINISKIFREIMGDAEAFADYGDDVAYVIAWLLREAGCKGVTDEDVWRASLSDKNLQGQCFALFMWIATQHFSQSDNLPKTTAHKTEITPTTSS